MTGDSRLSLLGGVTFEASPKSIQIGGTGAANETKPAARMSGRGYLHVNYTTGSTALLIQLALYNAATGIAGPIIWTPTANPAAVGDYVYFFSDLALTAPPAEITEEAGVLVPSACVWTVTALGGTIEASLNWTSVSG